MQQVSDAALMALPSIKLRPSQIYTILCINGIKSCIIFYSLQTLSHDLGKGWGKIFGKISSLSSPLPSVEIFLRSPYNANVIHIILSLAGGTGFTVGMGAISNQILNKTSLVFLVYHNRKIFHGKKWKKRKI